MKVTNNQYHEYKMNPMELNLNECFWDMLEQWKAVLIVALVCAALISAALGHRANRIAAQEEVKAESVEDVVASLSESDMQEVSYTMELREKYYNMNDYFTHSVLMNLDPNNTKSLKCEWLITGSQSYVDVLKDEYQSELLSDETLVQIIEEVHADISLSQFKELFVFDTFSQEIATTTDENVVALQFKLYIPENVDEKLLKTAITSSVDRVHDKIDGQIIPHQCKLQFARVETEVYNNVYTLQYNRQSSLMNLRNNYYNNLLQLSPEQKTAFNQLLSLRNKDESEKAGDKPAPAAASKASWFNLKYLVFGFICGMVLYAICLICSRLFLRETVSSDMIRDSAGIKKLGEIYPNGTEGKGAGLFHDRRLYAMHHRGKTDSEAQIDRALQAIKILFKKESMQEAYAYLLHDLTKPESEALEQICGQLREAGITLTVVDKNEFDRLRADAADGEIQGALLVANHSTRESSLESVLETLDQYETPVYGYIYLG